MFCLKCGAVLKDGARFCEKCGTPVVQIASADAGGWTDAQPQTFGAEAQPQTFGAEAAPMDDGAYPTDVMASDYGAAYLDAAGQQAAPAYFAGQQAAPVDFASQPTTQVPYGDFASQPTTQVPYGDFASQPTTQMPYGDFASQPTTQMPVDQQGGVWFQGQDWRAGAQPGAEPPVAAGGKRHGGMAALISVLSVLLVGIIGVSVYFVFFANPSSPSTGDAKTTAGAAADASSSSASASGAAQATGVAATTTTKTSTATTPTASTSGSANTSAKASTSGSTTAAPATSQNAALPTSNPYASLTADYVIPDSSTRTLSTSDLTALSAAQLKVARNEIFARHGRMFKDADLDAYFRSRHWYVPSVDADTFDANTSAYLNDVENANVSTIRSYEQQMGYL